MITSDFSLFNEQQDRFRKEILEYDPKIRFPSLRGNFKKDNPGNWFICFVPASWGEWKGASYGVHFGLIYTRIRSNQTECFRLAIGVEAPLQEQYRQSFKEDVIAKVKLEGISQAGFTLQAANRKKLLEADPITFGPESWRIALDRYIALRPVVDVIGQVVRDFSDRGAFNTTLKFQHNLQDLTFKI